MAWQRVRGHEALAEAFQRAARRGRLAHAYLFVGPTGVGKHLFAVELTKALLCESPREAGKLEACDHCPSCLLVEAGTHPDFYHAVRPAEAHEFPIELMRELCQGFSLRSARGHGKVVLIEDADDLNDESANCFLKTLEEPPKGSVLILIGSSPDRQLPTVVSRCQVVRFAPLSIEVVADLLGQQEIGAAPLREKLARLSEGSPGIARELSDPRLWDARCRLLSELSRPSLDPVTLAREWMEVIEEAGSESAKQRGRLRLLIRLLTEFLADALSVRQGARPRHTETEDLPALKSLAGRFDVEQLLALIERALEADAQVERRVQLVLVVEALLDAIAQSNAGRTTASEK